MIPHLLIIADRDVIDKFQEEVLIRSGLIKLKENLNLNLFNIDHVLVQSKKCFWKVNDLDSEVKYKVFYCF